MFLRVLKSLSLLMLTVIGSCIQVQNPQGVLGSDKMTVATACNECHSIPGSVMCKSDSSIINGKKVTQCFLCHNGSVKVDSSYDEVSDTFIYYDRMMSFDGMSMAITGSEHANSKLTLNFAQCTQCHSSPPNTGLHSVHVIDNGKKCLDCHALTIEKDVKGSDSTGWFLSQRMQTVPGGDLLPIPVSKYHMNNKIDISFKYNDTIYEKDYPELKFNKLDKSCTDIKCHSGAENGGASVELEYWKEAGK